MSLVRLGVRVAAVHALLGRTYAEANVHDSKITPLDALVKETAEPFVIITTDDDDQEMRGRDVNAGPRRLDLVIEFGLASTATDGEVTVPHTDAGMEIVLDLMQRQILRALVDEASAYSTAFKRLVTSINGLTSRRGASAEDGVRYAARQMIINVDTINDPGFGAALDADHPLATLADLLADQDDTAGLAALIRSHAEGTPLPDYSRLLIDLGMLTTAARGIALGGYNEGEAPATLDEVTVASDDDDGHTMVLTADDAEAQFPDA